MNTNNIASRASWAWTGWLLALTLLTGSLDVSAQDASSQDATSQATPPQVQLGFWNLENLFDSDDDPTNPGDDEFLAANGWDTERYQKKLAHLAEIVAELDCHLLGVAEVENRRVLDDLIAHEKLAAHGYAVAHVDSPDKRGIDVAAIYRAPVTISDPGESVRLHTIPIDPPTRGVLEIKASIAGAPVTFLVNHWPSRRGGTDKTRALRQTAAEVTKRVVRVAIDSSKDRDADVIVVGDFNDDPFDPSVRYHLGAIRNAHAVRTRTDKRAPYRLYNPTWVFFGKPGMGTLYYNREWIWNLFDQIIVSRGLLDDVGLQIVEESIDIYGPDKMRDQYRRPLRFRKGRGDQWTEGYSDHLPIRARFRILPPPVPGGEKGDEKSAEKSKQESQ